MTPGLSRLRMGSGVSSTVIILLILDLVDPGLGHYPVPCPETVEVVGVFCELFWR